MVISPVHYIALPLFAAFLMPLLAKVNRELVRIIPGVVLVYLSVVSVILMQQVVNTGQPIVETLAGWQAPWGINLVFSQFTGFLVSLMTFMATLIWVFSYRFKKVDNEPALKYYILFMMLVTGSVGVVLTGDIFNMFVFMEITAIASYSLTSFYRDRDGAEAGFKYLLIGSLASTFMLLAILLLYTQVGTLNMAMIAERMHTVPTGMKVTILILFVTGLGIEAEMFPLNGWAPDAYSQSPSPVGATFAALVVKAGVYSLIRVIFTLFDIQGAYQYLIVMGIITLVIAEFAAMKQTNLKRMLAYSSIGQMGFVLIAFGIGTKEAVFGALFLMFNHAVIKSLLFMSGSFFVYNSTSKEINGLSGIGKKFPYMGFLFSLGAFAIVGLPPFSGFWSKLYILIAAADESMLALVAIILMVSIVEIVYYFRVVAKLYFGKPTDEEVVHKPTFGGYFSMTVLAAVILVVGFYPDLITGFLHRAADTLLDKGAYISNVLGH
jgi:proton-translocating NADH-quinone oxidoreductase chain N